MLSVFNFVEDGHILESSFALPMTVKIEADGRNAVFFQIIGELRQKGPLLIPHEAVHDDD